MHCSYFAGLSCLNWECWNLSVQGGVFHPYWFWSTLFESINWCHYSANWYFTYLYIVLWFRDFCIAVYDEAPESSRLSKGMGVTIGCLVFLLCSILVAVLSIFLCLFVIKTRRPPITPDNLPLIFRPRYSRTLGPSTPEEGSLNHMEISRNLLRLHQEIGEWIRVFLVAFLNLHGLCVVFCLPLWLHTSLQYELMAHISWTLPHRSSVVEAA